MTLFSLLRRKASKINYALKGLSALDSLENMQNIICNTDKINKIRASINAFIHFVEFSDLKIKAERFEFKEEWKKAISAYKDVLFYLTKDDIPDEDQKEIFDEISAKIHELEGKIPQKVKSFQKNLDN